MTGGRQAGGETIWDFLDEFLVVCPACARRATVTQSAERRGARLVCPGCALVREAQGDYSVIAQSPDVAATPPDWLAVGASVDAFFHLPLWLTTSCAGETLWAYNAAHLAALRSYVSAKERPRQVNEHGRRNAVLASRLPCWMILAKNRDAVLHGIATLEARLIE